MNKKTDCRRENFTVHTNMNKFFVNQTMHIRLSKGYNKTVKGPMTEILTQS